MSVIYRCDHCAVETDARSINSGTFHEIYWGGDKYLLCDSCHKTLNKYVLEFLQEKRKEEE